MRTHRIAVVGLADDATQAFRSMLKIVEGRANANWQLASPSDADVLIAGNHSDDPAAERWARTDKPLIAVYEGTGARPLTAYALHHPFRVMQLIGVLDEIEQSLSGASSSAARGAVTAVEHAQWQFADSLRRLGRSTATGTYYVASGGADGIHVRDDLSCYYASAGVVRQLRDGELRLPALKRAGGTPPASVEKRPGYELAWFAGWFGGAEPAPWLERNASFRLRRWPDFGLVRGSREQLALAALLSRGSFAREQLIATSHQSAENVNRFLNACSLTGVLQSMPEAANDSTPTFIAASTARLGGFIRGLRARLGMAVEA